MPKSNNKKKSDAIQKALKDINKIYKSNDRKFAGNFDEVNTLKGYYSTGSIQLDKLIKGGYLKGHITEIYGPESSGKTTSCLHAIADCQSKGDTAVFLDMEGTFDDVYAQDLGVNMDDLIYLQANTGEQGLTMLERLIRSDEVGLVCLDSIASLLPEKEAEGDYGDAQMGSHARLMSQVGRKFTPLLKKHNVAAVFTNQIREKIGGYGNPEYATGGNAMKYYASVRLDIRRSGSPITDNDGITIGEPRKVKIKKSKVSSHANAIITFDIYYGEGIDQVGEVLDMCLDKGIIEKAGSWFTITEGVKEQGRESTKQFLRDNVELLNELKTKVISDE